MKFINFLILTTIVLTFMGCQSEEEKAYRKAQNNPVQYTEEEMKIDWDKPIEEMVKEAEEYNKKQKGRNK